MRSGMLSVVLVVLLSQWAAPAMALEAPSWLEPIMPKKGDTLKGEIKCYSLPYGGIGFLSHCLTYWALFWLWKGRRPYFPWKKLSQGKIDMALSIIQVVATVAIAAFTIARCKNRWQFITIAVWKLLLSLEVGIWGFRASLWARRNARDQYKLHEGHVIGEMTQWGLLAIYALVTVMGLAGLISLIVPIWHRPEMVTITVVFAAVGGASLFLSFFWWLVFKADITQRYSGLGDSDTRTRLTRITGSRDLSMTTVFTLGLFIGLMSVLMFLFALYCDWTLAVFAENYTGIPSGDNAALYWTYFAAKRLPLLLT